MSSVCDNIKNLRKTIESINKNAKLMAVSKTFGYDKVKEAYSCGQRLFGENRVQEAIEKIELSKKDKLDIEWHLIGHLQKNKSKKAVFYFDCIESVDSLELAERIDTYSKEYNKMMDVMLEVNIAKEEQKYGFLEEKLMDSIKNILELENINVVGLMSVAPISENPEDIRWVFKRLHELALYINKSYNANIKELSMGMSADYKAALQEGSTIVRIGRGIFGERDYS